MLNKQIVNPAWLALLLGLVICIECPAAALTKKRWAMPLQLDDSNTRVSFEVDSTWHLVKGRTNGISGRAWLESPDDIMSIRGELSIPVGAFDTGSSMRDRRLREVMAEESFPRVKLQISSLDNLCSPEHAAAPDGCNGKMIAELLIRNVRKTLTIPYSVREIPSGYEVSGDFSVRWADYNVEDPSIMVAKLHDTVKVFFEVYLPFFEESSR